MTLSVAAPASAPVPPRLIPSPRRSANHASFDVLLARTTAGADVKIGLVPGQRFSILRGNSYDDAVAGARQLVTRTGNAHAVVAAHPGQLFVVPAFVRSPEGTPDVKLGADLAALAGTANVARHGRVLAVVGAEHVLDLRELAPGLGSGRG